MSVLFGSNNRLDRAGEYPSRNVMTWMFWVCHRSFAGDATWPTYISYISGGAPCVQLSEDTPVLTIGSNIYNSVTGSTLELDRWYHLTWVRAGQADNRLYLNGKLDIYETTVSLGNGGETGVQINSQNNGAFNIDGYMAQHRIWANVLLTQQEILREMKSPIAIRRNNLWAEWPLNSLSTITKDVAGSRDLSLVGTPSEGIASPVRYRRIPKIWWLGGLAVTYQFLRPSADTSLGSWTDEAGGVSNIYTHIDEVTANDSDYVQSPNNPSSNIYKFKLTTGDNPAIYTDHVISYRYRKPDNIGTVNLKVRLVEGTTTRKEWTHSGITTTWVDAAQTLTEGEAAAITDYSNLYIELEAL